MNWNKIVEVFSEPVFTLGKTPVSWWTLLQFVVVVVLVFLMSHFTRRFLRTRVLVHTHLNAGLQYLIARIAGYVVLVLGVLIGLQTLGLNLSSLAVVAGALGVGIGFGLQNIVHNFVSGLILMGERAIQIGDRVEVGGTMGKVARIGARSTSIVTNENIMIIVPNSEFVSNRVVNWSYLSDQRVRLSVPVGVSYRNDPQQVRQILLEVATANSNVMKEPAPSVLIHDFGDSAVDYELRVWTTAMYDRPAVLKSDLYFAIWEKFKDQGIEIPFPQRDLHVKEPIKVELAEPSRLRDGGN